MKRENEQYIVLNNNQGINVASYNEEQNTSFSYLISIHCILLLIGRWLPACVAAWGKMKTYRTRFLN